MSAGGCLGAMSLKSVGKTTPVTIAKSMTAALVAASIT